MEQLKLLLGITDNKQDALLNLVLEEARDYILVYCRRATLPPRLEGLIPRMAAALYRFNGYGQTDIPQTVKSVSQGNRSVSYEVQSSAEVFEQFHKQLNPFRRALTPSGVTQYMRGGTDAKESV